MTRFLKRSLLLVVPAAIAALALTVPASAGPDGTASATGVTSPALLSLITNDDLFSTADLSTVLDPSGGTQHYGPYTSSSTDSGTCGLSDWATDTFDRHFTVRSNGDGTFTVVEQFKNGSFVTMTSDSPGACETSGNHGHVIAAGKTGSMHGYFIIPGVVGPQTSNDPHCNATTMSNVNCDTQTFIDTHFTPCYGASVCPVTTFFFHYVAPSQGLIYNEWKNASTDRGGNSGDIASG
jgi:hypothetical protein